VNFLTLYVIFAAQLKGEKMLIRQGALMFSKPSGAMRSGDAGNQPMLEISRCRKSADDRNQAMSEIRQGQISDGIGNQPPAPQKLNRQPPANYPARSPLPVLNLT